MCGITGAYYYQRGENVLDETRNAVRKLAHRGPDFEAVEEVNNAVLGHSRLSIQDISKAGNQPMTDSSGRYTIIYNGEIYNVNRLRKYLQERGVSFNSTSDTEVLLELFANEGPECLQKLNGFFAFAIYDRQRKSLFLARDRIGQKPLYYARTSRCFYFASELNALMEYPVDRELDTTSVAQYFRLNYIPAPNTILSGVEKLMPGHYLEVNGQDIHVRRWYDISREIATTDLSYGKSLDEIVRLTEISVKDRLISDVPLGSFLSGGVDSSIITMLAKRHKPDLSTFSIGFRDDPYFDESEHAEETAKALDTDHHTVMLSRQDMLDEVWRILHSFDEPFGDSSAIPLFMLAHYTRKHVTVALSGDGADEIFSGYNKHRALLMAGEQSLANTFLKTASPLLSRFKGSRDTAMGNTLRKMKKYAHGLRLDVEDRYWNWASFMDPRDLDALMACDYDPEEMLRRESGFTQDLDLEEFNDFLLADLRLVLPNDMLKKVDHMCMAHNLEVRCPFLDYRLVEFAFSLPSEYKISAKTSKRILRDAFRGMLPDPVFERPKRGFEVPLTQWLLQDLKEVIDEKLDPDRIRAQGYFNADAVASLRKALAGPHPGDAAYNLWAMLVFQVWYDRFITS